MASQTPPPIPTQSPIAGSNGLVTRVWISWFTFLGGLYASINSPAFTGTPTVPTAPVGTDTDQIASTAFTAAAVAVETTRAEAAEALLAPLISPALTGTPTAPTASLGTSTTQLATTAFVGGAVAVETSRAIAVEALKAPLASPALTGTPTVPTAAPGTNTAQASSTAFTTAAVAVETSRATAAEALKAPIASPTFTGIATAPEFTDGYNVYSLAQINRAGGNVEMQYAGGSGNNVRAFGNTATPIVLNTNGSISLAAAQTTVNGSTSGSAIFSQPEQGPSYKKVVVVSTGLSGTAVYTFPTPFVHTPGSIAGSGSALSVSAVSPTACTITSTGGGGMLVLEGF